jgi:hypothetical protein
MQKSILAFLSFSTVILLSCSLLGKYSEVEYHNLVIESVKEASLAIEDTAVIYNGTLPDVVTEQVEVDTSEMQAAYDDAAAALEDTEELLTLEAQNIEQQNAVRTELETYRTAAALYLESYEAMLTYYEDGTYKTDLTQVKPLDEAMYINYTTFTAANNDLMEIMNGFVKAGEEG